MSNEFDMLVQGTKTIQDLLNNLKKYVVQMIHPPNVYTFHKQFVSALHNELHNGVLKKGYTAEFSIEQLFNIAQMIEEASQYDLGMQHREDPGSAAASATWFTSDKPQPALEPMVLQQWHSTWPPDHGINRTGS